MRIGLCDTVLSGCTRVWRNGGSLMMRSQLHAASGRRGSGTAHGALVAAAVVLSIAVACAGCGASAAGPAATPRVTGGMFSPAVLTRATAAAIVHAPPHATLFEVLVVPAGANYYFETRTGTATVGWRLDNGNAGPALTTGIRLGPILSDYVLRLRFDPRAPARLLHIIRSRPGDSQFIPAFVSADPVGGWEIDGTSNDQHQQFIANLDARTVTHP
jgi:hypothetical protein